MRYHQARINRQQQRIADLDGIRGREAFAKRKVAREGLARAEQALTRAEEQAAAGAVDLRGLAERKRDRRDRKARARGGSGRSVNVTDPDSRLMTHGAGGGSVQGYNAQIAVTDDHLVLGIHLSQDANDTNCFEPTLGAVTTAATNLDLEVGIVLADAGYFTDDNLTLPGPDRLIAPGKNRDVITEANSTPTSGPPPSDATCEEAMRHRLRTPEGVQLYKRRSATVEPVIAHLKDQTGLRRFTRRGIKAVTAELHLAAAVINLRRMHATRPSTS